MKGIILAGGYGTRLYPLTITTSKQLLPVYDKPMIYYPLSTLMQAGIRDILIITTPKDSDAYMELLGDGSMLGVNLSYEVQWEPKGIAQAFVIGTHFIGDDAITLILGDNLFIETDEASFTLPNSLLNASYFARSNNERKATIFCRHVKNPQDFGVIQLDEFGCPISIEEKPENPKSDIIATGLYVYDNSVLDFVNELHPSGRNELEISDLNRLYMNEKRLRVEKVGESIEWFDAGTFDGLMAASSTVMDLKKYCNQCIAYPEEIAYKHGWIRNQILYDSYENTKNSQYGQHLHDVLIKKIMEGLKK